MLRTHTNSRYLFRLKRTFAFFTSSKLYARACYHRSHGRRQRKTRRIALAFIPPTSCETKAMLLLRFWLDQNFRTFSPIVTERFAPLRCRGSIAYAETHIKKLKTVIAPEMVHSAMQNLLQTLVRIHTLPCELQEKIVLFHLVLFKHVQDQEEAHHAHYCEHFFDQKLTRRA